MIDTITIELDSFWTFTSGDFPNKTEWSVKHQLKPNAPVFMSNVAIGWPDGAEEKWEYLPEVKYMKYPNPRGKGEDSICHKYWVTFSAPKLLYGNNIEEVTEDQFDIIVDKLYEQLQFLNLPSNITKANIRKAKVRRVDYSKNMMIAETIPVKRICNLLMRSEHTYNSKYTQVQYRNGDLYRENIKHRSVVLYDKLAEFSNTTKQPANIREQFFMSAEKAGLFQVIKLEVQIQNTQQLKNELGADYEDVSFASIFKEGKARRILMKYWDRIVKNIEPSPEPFSEDSLLTTFAKMVINEPNKKPQKVFATFGFSYLAHKCGMDSIKKILYKYRSRQSWSRSKKELYREPSHIEDVYSFLNSMEECLKSMEPIRFEEEDENVKNW